MCTQHIAKPETQSCRAKSAEAPALVGSAHQLVRAHLATGDERRLWQRGAPDAAVVHGHSAALTLLLNLSRKEFRVRDALLEEMLQSRHLGRRRRHALSFWTDAARRLFGAECGIDGRGNGQGPGTFSSFEDFPSSLRCFSRYFLSSSSACFASLRAPACARERADERRNAQEGGAHSA